MKFKSLMWWCTSLLETRNEAHEKVLHTVAQSLIDTPEEWKRGMAFWENHTRKISLFIRKTMPTICVTTDGHYEIWIDPTTFPSRKNELFYLVLETISSLEESRALQSLNK